MAGLFTTTKDTIKDTDKKTLFDKVAEEMTRKPQYIPDHAPIKALFYGSDGTGKSGTALTLVDMINVEEGEKIALIDLDSGNQPSILEYHREAYENGNIILFDPMEWKEADTGQENVVVDYLATMGRIKAAGVWIKKNFEKEKIRAVILDGLSTLLKHAEYQMRVEKNLDDSGGVTQRYWVTRNKSFLEMMHLYKSIPLDVIFIGHGDFNVDDNDKEAPQVKKNTNDMMFQKVSFSVEETPDGLVRFWAKIDKSKQNLKNKGSRVMFAEVDIKNKEKDYYWYPESVMELLKPDPTAQNSAKKTVGKSSEDSGDK